MKKKEMKDLDLIYGGAVTINGTLINSFVNIIKILLEAGKGVGSSIRRVSEQKSCPLE